MVGNGVGGNVEGMECVCNGVRKFLIYVKNMGVHQFSKMISLMGFLDLHT